MSDTEKSERPRRKKTTLTLGSSSKVEEVGKRGDVDGQQPPEVSNPVVSRENNRMLQWTFFGAITFGTLFALLGVVFDNVIWIGLAGPLGAIVAFYLLGLARGFGDSSDTRQQFADSCYFLGFILTMVAMLAGFMPAGLFGEDITSQGILRHFSMALGATALGLIFRILVLQGGRSVDQVSSELETDLILYARTVSEEAKAIGEELKGARSELTAYREVIGELVTTQLGNALDAALEPVRRTSSAISSQLQVQTDQIAEAATRLQAALSATAEKIAEAEQIETEAENKLAQAGSSVSEALTTYSQAIERLQGRLVSVGTKTADDIENFAAALSQGIDRVPLLVQAASTLEAKLQGASSKIDAVTEKSEAVAAKLNAELEKGGLLITNISETQDRVISKIDEAGKSAADGIATQAAVTSEVIRTAGAGAAETLSQEAEKSRGGIGAAAADFNDELAQATQRLVTILKDFAAKIDEAGKPQP